MNDESVGHPIELAAAAATTMEASLNLLTTSFLNPKPIFFLPKTPKPLNKTSTTFTCNSTKWADRLLPDFNLPSPITTTTTMQPPPPPPPPPPTSDRSIPLPIDFYQVLGAETHFLGDGIRRAFEAKVSKPPQFGFSQEALIGRRQILQAACDTLSSPGSRADYNRGLLDEPESTRTAHVPWDKVRMKFA